MYDTSYDENTIREFRKTYRWGMRVQQFCYPPIIIALFFIENFIPDWVDTFGYYDVEKSFHYLFGIKKFVINCICLLTVVTLFYIIPHALKAVLKERYVEFLVAKHNGNLYDTKSRIRAFPIILAIFVALSAYGIFDSWKNIGYIIVTDEGFHIQNNKFFTSTIEDYTFDYLDDNRPIFDGYDVAFGKILRFDNGGGWKRSFSIGKYSPHLEQFLNVLDEKTNGKYHLLMSVKTDIVRML